MKNPVSLYVEYLNRKSVEAYQDDKKMKLRMWFVNPLIYIMAAVWAICVAFSTIEQVKFMLDNGTVIDRNLFVFVFIQFIFAASLIFSYLNIAKLNKAALTGNIISIHTLTNVNILTINVLFINLISYGGGFLAKNYNISGFSNDILSINSSISAMAMLLGFLLLGQSISISVLRALRLKSENDLTI